MMYEFVFVYDEVSGFDMQKADVMGTPNAKYHAVLREAGKNVLARGVHPSNLWTEKQLNEIESKVSPTCIVLNGILMGLLMSRDQCASWKYIKAINVWESLGKLFSSRDRNSVSIAVNKANGNWAGNLANFVSNMYANFASWRCNRLNIFILP